MKKKYQTKFRVSRLQLNDDKEKVDQTYFLEYDLKASLAHATMLRKINVVSANELQQVEEGLTKIGKLYKQGAFIVRRDQEDCHTAIEQWLTENCGDVGKKIHTGRSRNDQSLTMIRLFCKDALASIVQSVNDISGLLEEKAKEVVIMCLGSCR